MVNTVICDTCSKEYAVGEWPYCPHGIGTYGDDPIEPYFAEHISPTGEWITSRGQRRAIMAKRGLDIKKPREDYAAHRVYFDRGKR